MFSVLVAGVGGQGSILASHIYADAAISSAVEKKDEALKVRLGETFGAAMRGGAVASHVKIGQDVYNPLIPENKADVILGLEPLEALRVGVKFLKPEGTVILNKKKYEPVDVKTGKAKYPDLDDIIKAFEKLGAIVMSIDATDLAIKAGTAKTMNVVMLGALSVCEKNPVPEKYLRESIKNRVPASTIEMNNKAFNLGYSEAESFLRG